MHLFEFIQRGPVFFHSLKSVNGLPVLFMGVSSLKAIQPMPRSNMKAVLTFHHCTNRGMPHPHLSLPLTKEGLMVSSPGLKTNWNKIQRQMY